MPGMGQAWYCLACGGPTNGKPGKPCETCGQEMPKSSVRPEPADLLDPTKRPA